MTEMREFQIRQQNKIDTTLNWETNNPVLLSGEIGIEIAEILDKKELKMKIGHNNLNWNDLEYINDNFIVVSIKEGELNKITYDEIRLAIINNKTIIIKEKDLLASVVLSKILDDSSISLQYIINNIFIYMIIHTDNTISEHFVNLTTETQFMKEIGNIYNLTTEAGDVVGAINEVRENMADKITISSYSETNPVISLINNDEKRYGELASLTINWFRERIKTYYQYTVTDGNIVNAESTEGLDGVEYTEVYCYTSPDGTDVQYISITEIVPTDSEGNEYIPTRENVPLSELNLEDDFITSIIFTSGSTATNLIYPEEILFAGDGEDCIDNVFTPIPNKRYNVFISYDGQYLIGEVGGVNI